MSLPPVAMSDSAPPAKTFEALLAELKVIRAQKAELEKREKAITEELVKKHLEQKKELETMGVMATIPVPRMKGDDLKRDEKK
jgi:hypothetical protein